MPRISSRYLENGPLALGFCYSIITLKFCMKNMNYISVDEIINLNHISFVSIDIIHE